MCFVAPKPLPNSLVNVPTPASVKADEDKYTEYRSVLTYMKGESNFTINPCDNFYDYACGGYKSTVESFDAISYKNYHNLGLELERLQDDVIFFKYNSCI